MSSKIVNQARQRDDLFFLQSLVVPGGGSSFMLLSDGVTPIQRETEGFAAITGSFIGGTTPFAVRLYIYPTAGAPVARLEKTSSPDPVTAAERVDFTKDITGRFVAIEVVETAGGNPIIVSCDARLRPVSSYDAEVEVNFDPGDSLPTRPQLGATVTHFNGNSGGASTPMFGANANRLSVTGINLGPRPITIAFGGAAVYGAGQTVPANTPFKFDRNSLSIAFIDDGGAGGAVVSATQESLP